MMKSSILLAVLCFSLLASTEALTQRKARVRIVNNSGRNIQPSSIYVAHKYSSVYKHQLKFTKGLSNGETDDAGGQMLVDYHTGFGTTGVDWWYVTWVFADDKAIYQTDPTNFRCLIDQIEKLGPKAIAAAAAAIAGVAACGLPPVAGCAASPAAAAGAAIAADVISKALLSDEATCGFKRYMLESEDDMNSSRDTWVTISINAKNGLTFSSPSGSAATVYDKIEIRSDGKVIIDTAKFSSARAAAAARAFGIKIPIAACKSEEHLLQSVDQNIV